MSASRPVLLLKSLPKKFANQPGYFLHNGHWHAVHKDVPKGAPLAAHPHAAGEHQPAKHFSDGEWSQLELPPTNSNAPTFNKQLKGLKDMSEAGHVTGILGSGYGVNTYGKKLATIANKLLGMHGSHHTVTPGQKAGEHHAVQGEQQAAPAQPEPQAAAPAPEPAEPQGPTVDTPVPEPTKDTLDGKAAEGDTEFLAAVVKNNEHNPHIAAYAQKLIDAHEAKAAAKTVPPNLKKIIDEAYAAQGVDYLKAVAEAHKPGNAGASTVIHDYVQKLLAEHKEPEPAPAPAAAPEPAKPALVMPHFVEGKFGKNAVKWYEKVAQQVIDLAAKGDAAGLEALKSEGLKPNPKTQKVGATWQGKTQNSSTLLSLHTKALAQAQNAAQAPEAKAPAPTPAPAPAEAPAPAPAAPSATTELHSQLAAAGFISIDGSKGVMLANPNGYAKTYANQTQASNAAQKLADAGFDAEVVGMHPYYVKVHKKLPAALHTPAVAAAGGSKVAQIPWADQYLPSGVNAASHNKKVDAIKNAAEAGDLAALEAMKFGVNTYGKKQAKLAQLAIAALKEDHGAEGHGQASPGMPSPQPAAPITSITDDQHADVMAWLNSPDDADVTPPEHMAAQKLYHSLSPELKKQLVKEQLAHAKRVEAAKQAAQPEAPSIDPSSVFYAGLTSIKAALSASDMAPVVAELQKTVGMTSTNAIKLKNYAMDVLVHMGMPKEAVDALASGPAPDETGPKDGDTKPGENGGTLVFKDGHWHLQDEPKAAEPAKAAEPLHPVDALGMPDLSTLTAGGQKSIAVGLHKLKEQVKAGDHSGLKGVHKFMSANQKHHFALPHPSMEGFKYKYKGTSDSNAHIAAYLADLKLLAAGKKAKGGYKTHDPAAVQQILDNAAAAYGWSTKPTAPTASPGASYTAAPAAPAAPKDTGIESIDGWSKQGGTQGGYTDGAIFTDPAGNQWYCKFHSSGEAGAKAEALSLKLYEAAGCDVPLMKVISHGGKVGTASKIIGGLTTDKGALQAGAATSIYSGYAADAWLANWDTVGNNPAAGKGFDNIQFANGKAYRIDAGGALMFKGTGAKKSPAEWSDNVVELKTLKDAGMNPNTAKAFKHMTEADIKASVAKVLAIPDWKIAELVKEFGPGNEADKIALTSKLVKRQQSMAEQYPDAKKKSESSHGQKVEKMKPDPTNLKVDPSMLPKPHDFMNWQGSGKPISDKPYVQHNAKAEQDILAFALKGNLVALKEYKFTPVDKLTGLPTGEAPKAIADHSSAHVKQFYDDCVGFLETLANPPEPLRLFDGKDANTVAELAAHFKPFDFGKGVGNVPANQRLGFWIALGHATDPKKFSPKTVGKAMSDAVKKKAYAAFQKLPSTVKTFIKAVQGSGSANQPYRDGKTTDSSGQDTRQVVADLYANGTEHDEGMSIYKWINMPDSMVKQLLAEPEGLVFQNPGSMCTSKHPTATSGFGEHRLTIHFAKGSKGIDTFGSGGFAGEQEITTIPGVRFMVLKREMVPGKGGSKNRLELELLMLPPDPTYLANLNRTPQVG